MKYRIALLKGDGVGPEIVDCAVKVLNRISKEYDIEFEFKEYLIGGIAYDKTGNPLPKETLEGALASDSVLLGAVGGTKWDNLDKEFKPETALLKIREAMEAYCNIRPVKQYRSLIHMSPLKEERIKDGFDIVIVRELTGGIYFGERGREGDSAFDTERYSVGEIERIGKIAFETAMKRDKKLVSIDKANVLESSRLWRETMERLARSYPEVQYSNMLVDNAAMQLVSNPSQFDVIVTTNMFGDILSDEASQITGSIGMLPSSSKGDGTRGIYEPIHGSAPDIAGMGKVNPIATILSSAMMLRDSFNLTNEAEAIERAVEETLEAGFVTADIDREKYISTEEITKEIINRI